MRASLHYLDGRHEIRDYDKLVGAYLVWHELVDHLRVRKVCFRLVNTSGWAWVYQELPPLLRL